MTHVGVKTAAIIDHPTRRFLFVCDNDRRAGAHPVYIWANRSGGTNVTRREEKQMNKYGWGGRLLHGALKPTRSPDLDGRAKYLVVGYVEIPHHLAAVLHQEPLARLVQHDCAFRAVLRWDFFFRGWHADSATGAKEPRAV